jgi:signal transduction histidine kinase
MRLITSLRLIPLKLHTKTIIIISGVLLAVFAVIAYFSDLATNNLNRQREQEQAELFAAQVADTVGYHYRHVPKEQRQNPDDFLDPHWAEIEEDIRDTIISSNPQLTQVRVYFRTQPEQWKEAISLPAGIGAPPAEDEKRARQQIKDIQIISSRTQGAVRQVTAIAPTLSRQTRRGLEHFGTAMVVLSFDESQSVVGRLRRLVWPLMGLAIVAITLVTYFLFRYLVYQPIDALLARMARAEAGDLAVESQPVTPDEVGLLTARFNRMLGRIREMTGQLELERSSLKGRVREATAELEGRQQQLEEATRRLFELQRQLSQLERLAAAGQLAAQFAHEVGTPLNLISGHVQVLRAHAQDERSIKRLNVVAGQIKRITQIVRSMLDSTRLPGLRLEKTDLNALLVKVAEAAQPTLAAHSVALHTALADEIPLIDVDPDQLQQVFINLINNSLDAMPAGGALLISTRHVRDGILVEVADTGDGIAAEQIEMIFDPLFTTKTGRGTGLGLTVVKQIVTEHGGRVEVASKLGQGATFRIWIPLQASASAAPDVQSTPHLVGAEVLETSP